MITAYKPVYLFGAAETGSEETGGLQGCAEALALSKTWAGLARAKIGRFISCCFYTT